MYTRTDDLINYFEKAMKKEKIEIGDEEYEKWQEKKYSHHRSL